MPPITYFHGDYFFLSNFYPCTIHFEEETYSTVEHAFQAAKTFHPDQRQIIRDAITPAQAKQIGRKVNLRADWEQVKVEIMLLLLRQKFDQPDLCQRLLNTGINELIEGNTWGDTFWGCVFANEKWVGKNQLGKLLMKIRAEQQMRST